MQRMVTRMACGRGYDVLMQSPGKREVPLSFCIGGLSKKISLEYI